VDRQGALHNDVMFASSDCLILGGIDLKPYDALGRYFGNILLIRSSACGIVDTRQPPVAELSRAVAAIIIFGKLH